MLKDDIVNSLSTQCADPAIDPSIPSRLSLVSAVTLLLLATVAMMADILSDKHFVGADFKSFYYASRAAINGSNFYDPQVLKKLADADHLNGAYPFLYPPVLPHALAPLARLSPAEAQTLWSIANCMAFCVATVISIVGIRRRQIMKGRSPTSWPLAVGIALCLAFILNLHNVVAMGQINIFILMFVVAGIMLPGEQGHAASIGMALAILIKATPVFLLVVCFAERRLRFVRRTCFWIMVLIAASLGLGAGPSWVSFLKWLPSMSYGSTVPGLFPANIVYNISIAGFFARLSNSPGTTRILSIITLALLSVPVLWKAKARRNAGVAGRMLSACVILVVGAPFAYIHHVIFLLPVLLWCLTEREAISGMRVILYLALGIIAVVDFPVLYDRFHFNPETARWITSINLYALLGLYGLGVSASDPTKNLAAKRA